MENNCKIETSLELTNNEEVLNFSYKWVIDNLDSSFNSSKSPKFSNETNNSISWYMKIHSKSDAASSLTRNQFPDANVEETIYCVKLCLAPIGATKLQADCKVQLLSVTPENTYSCKKVLRFRPGRYFDCFELSRRDLINPQNGFLQDGKIILTCDIKAVIDSSISRLQPRSFLSHDMQRFFENRQFTDVTLCASGEEFPAHKAILAARSPVFSAMFESGMEESQQNRVNIPDIDGRVLQELLRYIYTEEVFNLEEYAFDLLRAADKYELSCLKVLCGEELCTNISIESVAEVLVLADLHKVEKLKAVAIEYIGTHAEDVWKTDGWNSLIQSYPHLIAEVECDVSKQHQVMIS